LDRCEACRRLFKAIYLESEVNSREGSNSTTSAVQVFRTANFPEADDITFVK
jgi:hypothetical protein